MESAQLSHPKHSCEIQKREEMRFSKVDPSSGVFQEPPFAARLSKVDPSSGVFQEPPFAAISFTLVFSTPAASGARPRVAHSPLSTLASILHLSCLWLLPWRESLRERGLPIFVGDVLAAELLAIAITGGRYEMATGETPAFATRGVEPFGKHGRRTSLGV